VKGFNDRFSWGKAGQIWYSALTDSKMVKDCDFEWWALLTVEKGRAISREVALMISAAWAEVGIKVSVD